MFTFTPLYGAQTTSPASSSLLEFDGGIKVLVDIGWDASFSISALQDLEKHVSTLSLLLLTHPTLDHLGAYAHACKHIPLFAQVPVYATIPVVNLGLTLLTDLYASSELAASVVPPTALGAAGGYDDDSTPNLLLQPPTPDEISSYFNRITPLKYSQPHQPVPSPFSPPLNGLTVAAYAAGHTLGGTIWHLQHSLESVVYAADWNQGRENLLSGAAWLSSSSGGAEIIEPLRRPTALVCSSRGIEVEDPLPRRKRDETLVSLIRDTIAQGGTVLIPTDSSARVLELAFLLNQTWRENVNGPHAATYRSAKVYLASSSATSTMRYLQSMLEWMDDTVVRDAEAAMTTKGKTKTANPLEWSFVRMIEGKSQLDRVLRRSKPSIILGSDASLEWGFSRLAFQALASDARNLVILTETSSTPSRSLGSQLWDIFQAGTAGQTGARLVTASDATVNLHDAYTSSLDSNEQLIYDQYLARVRALTTSSSTVPADGTTGQELAEAEADVAVSESSDSEDDDIDDPDAQQQGRALNLSAQLSSTNKRKAGLTEAELGLDVLLKTKVHDYDVRGKRGREKMFPFRQMRKRGDDFGEAIVVGEFLRAEEKEAEEGAAAAATANGASDRKLGEKRKWDDVSSGPGAGGAKGRRTGGGQNKRAKTQPDSRAPDDVDAVIARATGQVVTRVNGHAADGVSDSESDESEYEPDEGLDALQGPKKVTFTSTALPVSARIAFVDFSARHEKRDLLMLIPLIRPRKLILISGSEGETQTLARETRALLGIENGASNQQGTVSETEVFLPLNGETVDASVDTNAWTLKLGRNLLRHLVWQEVKGLGIVALTGLLHTERHSGVKRENSTEADGDGDDAARKKRKLSPSTATISPPSADQQNQEDTLPILDVPSPTSSPQHLHIPRAVTNVTRPIHVGDLRLSDLRHLLRAAGHMAEFRGEGTLLVDGFVVVRKSAGGRIDVEGGVFRPSAGKMRRETTFGEVKRKVYEGLAVVGGESAAG